MPNETQLELLRPVTPAVDPRTVDHVKAALADGKWHTSKDVLLRLGWDRTGQNLRLITACANASSGSILSGPGSPGYKLTAKATIEEILAVERAITRQVEAMTSRKMEIQRRRHAAAYVHQI